MQLCNAQIIGYRVNQFECPVTGGGNKGAHRCDVCDSSYRSLYCNHNENIVIHCLDT